MRETRGARHSALDRDGRNPWIARSPRRPTPCSPLQRPDGHWVFELEADATIPAEYVLMRHYLGEPVDAELEGKIATYLRRRQGAHGGWPLFHDGDFDMSASVKAYFALKMIGDDVEAPHMRRAREAIRARGGAAQSNVFTRALLALFGDRQLARGSGHAGRDHAAAALVPVSSRQDFLLGAHGDRAAAGVGRAEAGRAQSEADRHRRTLSRAARYDGHAGQGAASEFGLVPIFQRRRRILARGRAAFSQALAQARDRCGRDFRDRAAERRGRSRARSFPPWSIAC